MKRYLLSILTLLTLSATLHAADRPNVIIIYGDDVGYADLGVYGSTKIPTPHLDKMAAEGLRFTDGHCAAATCTPSRYSMLTGSMAFRKSGTGILSGNAKMAIDPDQYTPRHPRANPVAATIGTRIPACRTPRARRT